MLNIEEFLINLSDMERTYYEYHGKLDDDVCLVELSIEGRLVA